MRGKCKGKRENYTPFTRLPRTNCSKPPSFHLFPDRDFSQNNGVGRKRSRLERLKPIATRGESKKKKSSRIVASALWKKRPKVAGPNVSFLPFLSLLQALGELQWEIEWTDTLRHCHSLSLTGGVSQQATIKFLGFNYSHPPHPGISTQWVLLFSPFLYLCIYCSLCQECSSTNPLSPFSVPTTIILQV